VFTTGGDDFKDLFRPFEKRGTDRSGLGIGLAFCRWGAEANNGGICARNLPGKGCDRFAALSDGHVVMR
jgi:signal transduction histidine kinase